MINCKTCNKETSNPLFCSRSCAAKFNNPIYRKKIVYRKCNECGKQFLRKNWRDHKVRCEDCTRLCAENTKKMTLKEYYSRTALKGKHPSWINSGIRGFCRSWNKDMRDKPCINCGYDKHTNLCHVKPLHKFELNVTLGEVNDSKNLVVLCPNCHWEFDHGLLELNKTKPS